MRTSARFPEIDHRTGHYESFYLKATEPSGGRGVWIRYTVHKRPNADPTCSLWFTLFAPDAPQATKVTFDATSLTTPQGSYIRIAEAEIAPGRAYGSISSEALNANWDLTFSDRHQVLRHLPADWMYTGPLPRTKLLSPHPGVLWSGRLTVDNERIDLRDWPGMVGHNWGREHAERWIWLHAPLRDGGYLDIGAGRIKLGPLTTPWVANGMLVLDGAAHRLGGLPGVPRTHIDELPDQCNFVLPSKEVAVRGRVSAPRERYVGWVYADPDGGEHNTVNCSIADLDLEIDRPGETPQRMHVSGSATYELGMRETDHGIPMQPFPDG
ncbi:hypothetical protein ONR57_01510 [Hoyosella sp. YIM 151337]|uniref:hypothetical protein n=1 Tax=Hoyosella sp. YIM 151337 TaxID=2992742 RepID=UPI00223565A9|nr:hypothetical protein [Hoyosella sp. YIM 151337]MCW4351976.1 hypothetical protein [Hoyosella sp. YIM 151337]